MKFARKLNLFDATMIVISGSTVNRIESAPIKSRERCGKFRCGWSRPNTPKPRSSR